MSYEYPQMIQPMMQLVMHYRPDIWVVWYNIKANYNCDKYPIEHFDFNNKKQLKILWDYHPKG